jgi:two-component system, response regulator PdtaR
MSPHSHMNWFIEMMDVVTDGPAPVVLIVESYTDLRMLAVQFLKEEGFETLEAGDADQAVAMLESRSEIAVLFTNIDLPGTMNGLKLARAAHNRWPAIEILIASGHVRLPSADLPPNGRFLEKPYRAEAMIAELRSLVDHAAPLMQA